MRKREVVKIDNKEFTIKELTVQDILEIVDQGIFLTGKLKDQEGTATTPAPTQKDEPQDFFSTLVSLRVSGFSKDINRVMDKCCDFTLDDLIKLAPSEIDELYEAFRRVNKHFLSTLKALRVTEALTEIRDAALEAFLKALAI